MTYTQHMPRPPTPSSVARKAVGCVGKRLVLGWGCLVPGPAPLLVAV